MKAVGKADHVDMSQVDSTTPFDKDVDHYRIIECYCCGCDAQATIHAEPGRTHPWQHALYEPTHVVDYHLKEVSR